MQQNLHSQGGDGKIRQLEAKLAGNIQQHAIKIYIPIFIKKSIYTYDYILIGCCDLRKNSFHFSKQSFKMI